MRMLAGRGLHHSFGGVSALCGVDVDIAAGEVLGVIGPNGSGKTTLVDALTGMLRPDAGDVELAGVDVTGHRAASLARHGLARTFQSTRLMEPLSVRDNVLLGLHSARVRRGRRRQLVDGTLTRLGLTAVANTAVRELSHGQRRRVELARALVSTPAVLVLDEPTAGLFGPDAHDVAMLLGTVARSGTAVLIVEHDLGVIAEVCNRLVVLSDGVVVDSGTTRPVLAGAAVAALRGELGQDRLEAASA